MRQLLTFVRKEFIHIFRDFRTLIILFGIPAAQIMIFGYVVTTDIRDAKVAFIDPSHDEVTRQIIREIDASDFFEITRELRAESEIESAFKSGEIKEVLIFEPDFGRRLIRENRADISLVTDGSEPNTARLVASYTQAIIGRFNREMPSQKAAGIQPEIRMVYNPRLETEYMFVPGLISLILTLICALMTSVTIVREKEFGTMEVLLASPLRPFQIVIGKVIPYLALAFVDVVIILIMANLIFGLPVKGNLILLLSESLLYIALMLSLGILISTVSKTMQQAIFLSLIGLMLPSIILSGFIFPIRNLPEFYQIFSLILPPRWLIVIIKNIMLKGNGFGAVWKETLILLGMTTFFIGLSAKQFKLRLE